MAAAAGILAGLDLPVRLDDGDGCGDAVSVDCADHGSLSDLELDLLAGKCLAVGLPGSRSPPQPAIDDFELPIEFVLHGTLSPTEIDISPQPPAVLIQQPQPYTLAVNLPPGTPGVVHPRKRRRTMASDGPTVVTFTTDTGGRLLIEDREEPEPEKAIAKAAPVRKRRQRRRNAGKHKMDKREWYYRVGRRRDLEKRNRLQKERASWTSIAGEKEFLACATVPERYFTPEESRKLRIIRMIYVLMRLQESRTDQVIDAYMRNGRGVFASDQVDPVEKSRLRACREHFLQDVFGGGGAPPKEYVRWTSLMLRFVQDNASLLRRLQAVYFDHSLGAGPPLAIQAYFRLPATTYTSRPFVRIIGPTC